MKGYSQKLSFFSAEASVAQMAEQLICNQWVGGSIPFAGSDSLAGEVPERSKGADCKSAGSAFGGSNPPLSTIQIDTRGREPFLSFEEEDRVGGIFYVRNPD